jgi:CheY-like chemotaxis protein
MNETLTFAIADDDEAHSELMVAWLELRGYRVHRFASGDDLVFWAQTSPEAVDVFLLDVDMPGRDGFESCRALRGIPIFRETPAVFVSSLADDLSTRAVESGGTLALRKSAELFDTLGSWLDTHLTAA